MTTLLTSFVQILLHTPFYVWVVLVILIQRGIALQKDGPVSIKKACIMPGIFIIWGLDKIFTQFSAPMSLLSCYLLFLGGGTIVGNYLYRQRTYYVQSGVLVQTGSRLPMVVMMSNFVVKYSLNVLLAVQPILYQSFIFNLIYGVISGFTVGLFIGGIRRSMQAKARINS